MKVALTLAPLALAAGLYLVDGDTRGSVSRPLGAVDVASAPVELVEPGALADGGTSSLAPAREAVPFLASVPFGPAPSVPVEKRYATTGVPPSFEDVLPNVEWGIRTRGYRDFEAAVRSAKHRVAPAKVEHLLPPGHPQLARARKLYATYLPRFEELAPEWAEANLRYRAKVFEEHRYHAWCANEDAPPEAKSSRYSSTQTTNGWKIWFCWEKGVEPAYDRVFERHASLNREFLAQIEHLRTL